MKTDRGFRIPEASDRAIGWPVRKEMQDAVIAVWSRGSAAWLVPGVDHAFGSGWDLVQRYGNDWHRLMIDQAPEAGR